jgi:hypothetical protein
VATTAAPYCVAADLMVGNSVMLPDSLDLDFEIQSAADDIDALLGFVYELPLDGLLGNEILLLKSINAKMASGRILLQLFGDGDGVALHAYGLRLLAEAQDLLMQLANGAVDLSAVRVDSTALDEVRGPAVKNYDEESGVTIFEDAFWRGSPSYWRPGSVN